MIASDVSRERVSVRPVFVGSLEPVSSPLWPEPVWSVPVGTDLDPGAFVFTNDGELAGLVVMNSGERTIVPGAVLVAEADRLLNRSRQPAGGIGVHVQPLTPALVSATGASAGVVVTWVDVNGVAAGTLAVGDVIEAVDGQPMSTQQHWDIRLARLVAGETMTLRLRRHGQLQEVQMVATAPAATSATPTLGLTMRRATRMGSEIVRIDRASVADRAGLQPGDVITLVADVEAPTPAQVTRAFVSAREGHSVLVAVTRGDTHHVMTLEK
ncbi:MAG: PDZ domain-containing protein [Acidobacteria bacterium]|nr:PDZ domain-containing protein [Acidobacteriota bacterium]